ncbi:MAG: HAD-IIA family hydrolase [Thermoplasmatota archaeon]
MIKKIRGAVLDIDGVLRRGQQPIKGSIEAVQRLVAAGIRIILLTNNSTKTRDSISEEIETMGFPRIPVVSSGYATAVYIKREFGPSRVLVVGEEGLMEELRLQGHDPVKAGDAGRFDIRNLKRSIDTTIDIVVAGMDRSLSYGKIADALLHIRNGAEFMGTNSDPTFPMEDGMVLPGAGSTLAPIVFSSGIDPLIIGKPDPFGTLLAVEQIGLRPEEVIVVGDRPDTDIKAGISAGCMVARVLTGEVGPLDEPSSPEYPDLLSAVDALL